MDKNDSMNLFAQKSASKEGDGHVEQPGSTGLRLPSGGVSKDDQWEIQAPDRLGPSARPAALQ
jgi:hypothetical protein